MLETQETKEMKIMARVQLNTYVNMFTYNTIQFTHKTDHDNRVHPKNIQKGMISKRLLSDFGLLFP